jgi:hypothetical protein
LIYLPAPGNISTGQVVESKGLLLENVHPNDEGVYECSAENTIGRISETIQLFVQV